MLKSLAVIGHLQSDDYPPALRVPRKCSYLLTPAGHQHRQPLALAYLERKTKEY